MVTNKTHRNSLNIIIFYKNSCYKYFIKSEPPTPLRLCQLIKLIKNLFITYLFITYLFKTYLFINFINLVRVVNR